MKKTPIIATLLLLAACTAPDKDLKINDLEYYQARGVNVLVYSNSFDGGFNDEKNSVSLDWHDVYDLNVKTGVVTPVNGTSYAAIDAEVSGNAWKQEATFATGGKIVTGISGNDSTVTFSGVQGSGKKQWVSFYYQNTDDFGFGGRRGSFYGTVHSQGKHAIEFYTDLKSVSTRWF